MKVGWKRQYEPRILAERLQAARVSTKGTHVHFDGFPNVGFALEIDRILEVVATAIQWPSMDLEAEVKHQILGRALAATAQSGPINATALLSSCETELKQWRRQPWSQFVVVSSISFHPQLRLFGRKLGGPHSANVRFKAKRDGKWNIESLRPSLKNVLPSGYTPKYRQLEVRLRAPDPSLALRAARKALDIRRAAWNWYFNKGKWTRRSGPPRPLNRIVWGPFATVHAPDGSLAWDGFNGESSFRMDWSAFSPSNLEKMASFERFVVDRTARSPIATHLERFLIGYVRALDETSHLQAFQLLWSLFEALTGDRETTQDRSVSRLMACYQPKDPRGLPYLKQELEHLRQVRNTLVHEGRSAARMWAAVQQLIQHVHAGLGAYFEVLYELPSLGQAYELLDLPRDLAQLRSRERLLRKAIHLRK